MLTTLCIALTINLLEALIIAYLVRAVLAKRSSSTVAPIALPSDAVGVSRICDCDYPLFDGRLGKDRCDACGGVRG